MTIITNLLLESLIKAPLLIGDLTEASCFDRTLFDVSEIIKDVNTNQKLGHLYEQALGILIKNSFKIELLGQNIQIFNDKKITVGELDFILLDRKRNAHTHLELGVKFYLAYNTSNGWQFPGPNDTDNWPKKLSRLQDHQLKLTRHRAAKDMLHNSYGIRDVLVRQLIYGCLFTPINCQLPAPKLQYMKETARTGKWLYAHQWDNYFSEHDEIYVIPKPLWPIIPNAEAIKLFDRYPPKEFLTTFRATGAMFITQNFTETCFLAADDWPKTIKSESKCAKVN